MECGNVGGGGGEERKKMGREEVYNRYYEKNEVVRYLVPGVLRYQVLIPGTAEERDVCRSRRREEIEE